jgi:SAM-dependent methyltransferase
MVNLFVVSKQLATPTVVPALNAYFAGAELGESEPVIVLPEGLELSLPRPARLERYRERPGIELSPDLFAELRRSEFETITVLGSRPIDAGEEIVLACYLSARRKQFLDASGGFHDIGERWQPTLKLDFRPREVRARRIPPDDAQHYMATVHEWLATSIRDAGHDRPRPVYERKPGTLLYYSPHLATDLLQHTVDLQVEKHGASFSMLMLGDQLVHSTDFYRAMANFVRAVPGIETVLDVGCGSGFLACHLAASRRYRAVVGCDAAPLRVNAARLQAELAGVTGVEFRQSSMDRLGFPDGAFDVIVTSFALEQSGAALGQVFSELRRVARRYLILFEPSVEYFPTLPSLWHVPASGWATQYFRALTDAGVSYAVRPNLLSHYYNPGAVFVIDLTSERNPMLSLPQLFRTDVADWPGGVRVE